MRNTASDLRPGGNAPRAEGAVAMVRAQCLRYFAELVTSKGGDPDALMAAARLDPAMVRRKDQLIAYRQMILLLENAADELDFFDLGLQLASRQYAEGILGPLDIAMRNSRTVGDAWRYCAEHVHAYSSGAHVTLRRCAETRREILQFDILLPRMYRQRQAVEHALLMSHLATKMFSGGQVVAREAWFTHAPLGGAQAHRENFGCTIRFGQAYNALFFSEQDFATPVRDPDEQVFELASFFIDARFPMPGTQFKTRVRVAIEQQLAQRNCTQIEVAGALGIHPRTLQRRLRHEGGNFEAIKDEVRRDAAVRYLRQTKLPLKTVAALLGYSELSVLYRSCQRWFGEPPSTVRLIDDLARLVPAEEQRL